MKKSRLSVGVVILVAVLAGLVLFYEGGCPMGPGAATWELDLWVHEENTLPNGTVEMKIEILLSGHTTGTKIENVELRLENNSGTELTRAHIGTIEGYTRSNVTIRSAQPPDKILVFTGRIQTGDETGYSISGLRRTSTGEFEETILEHQDC